MNARDLLISPEIEEREIFHYLESLGFQNPADADLALQHIVEAAGGPAPLLTIFDFLMEALAESADPDSSIKGMATFFENVPSLTQFIQVAAENPAILEVSAAVTGGSEFLTLILLKNPGYIHWLMEKDNLEICRDAEYFSGEAKRSLELSSDMKSGLQAMQRFQRREILRIGVQDLLRTQNMSQIARQISLLADAVLQGILDLVIRETGPLPCAFVVLAMGKLGGKELNFSSDVDLIFLYEDDSARRQALRLSRSYRKALTEDAPEGHFYRVDLRLRPMGKGGDMASSVSAAENYYKHWADTTDRLALIKARPVAGSLDLGEKFISSLQDFIYKKYQDFAAVDEIRLIKQRTNQELKKKNQIHSDIKLGLGGIREIEFFAQSFQILYGGNAPHILTPNTLEALDLLAENGFINNADQKFLKKSYIFLRNLEHKLQLVNYLQTQALPDKQDEIYLCARRMGYGGGRIGDGLKAPVKHRTEIINKFSEDLDKVTSGVNKIFRTLLQGESRSATLTDILLDKGLGKETALEKIREACNPLDPEGVLEGVGIISGASAFPHSPRKMRNLLANILPTLLERSAALKDPRKLFIRLDRFAEAQESRVALYSEMAGNQGQTDIILDILSSGPFLSEILIKRPDLADNVLTEPDEEPDYRSLLKDSIKLSFSRGMEFDNSIRYFKKAEEFKLGARELKTPGSPGTRELITSLAEACLSRTVEEMLQKYPAVREIPFSVAALGKMGGRELIFHSDLDLLFVYDSAGVDNQSVQLLLNFVKAIKNSLQEYTSHGRAYSLDFRLRPEGRSSTDIISRDQLIEYFETSRVETWERLAYVKARTIIDHGCPLPFPDLLKDTGLDEEQTAELFHIRNRKEIELGKEKEDEKDFKVGYGALLDSQFYVQMLQLRNNIFEPNSLAALDLLEANDVISSREADQARKTVKFFYALESASDLTSSPGESGSRIAPGSAHTADMARLLGYGSAVELMEMYGKKCEKNRQLLETLRQGN